MSVRFLRGDLFHYSGLSGLAHGCNCAGAMGKGIALEFKRRFPDMFEEYRRLCKSGDFKLGDCFTWRAPERTVFNLGTQRTWRTRADLGAIEAAVGEMIRVAGELEVTRIGLPRIGAGLGGLVWEDVKEVLTRLGSSADVELIVFEEFEAAT